MRWLVELPPPAGGTASTITVEADSWAGALTRGRGGTSVKKFRCEFEEDGVVRVHDLDSRERYTVRPVRPPSDRSSPVVTESAVDFSLSDAPAPAAEEAAPAPVAAPVVSAPSPDAAVAQPAEASAGTNGVEVPGAVSEGSSASIPPSAPIPQPTLLFERDQDPSPTNPLVYRERVFAVPSGTSRTQAEELARQSLAAVQRSMAAFDRGRYVMVAVFDHEFSSHPARPPLAVLQWKDWRGEPEISHPATLPLANGASDVASTPPGDLSEVETPAYPLPAAAVAPPEPVVPIVEAPPPSTRPAILEAVAETVAAPAPPAPTEAPGTEPVAEATTILVSAATVAAETASPAAPAPVVSTAHRPSSSPPGAGDDGRVKTGRKRRRSSSQRLSTEAASALAGDNRKTPIPEESPVSEPAPPMPPDAPLPVVEVPAPVPPPVVAEAAPAAAPAAVVAAAEVPAAPVAAPVAHVVVPRARQKTPPAQRIGGARQRGSDLLSDLFDAVIDLTFLQEAQEGCDFTAKMLRENVVSDAGIVLLYDIDRDELVVVSADGAPLLKDQREKLGQGARGKSVLRHAPVALDRAEGHVPEGIPSGPTLCVPVTHNQRLFAVLELRRVSSGEPYATDEQDAVVYVATQLGEFLAQHSQRVAAKEHSRPPARR